MKKDLFITFAFAILVFGGVDILGSIHTLEPVEAGEESEIYVNLRNNYAETFDDVSVKAYFFGWTDRVVSSEFDLHKNGDAEAAKLQFYVPSYVMPGEYLVYLTASNDDIFDTTFFTIAVQ